MQLHAPSVQSKPDPQALSQRPQSVVVVGLLHAPPQHRSPSLQTVSHPPQCNVSDEVSKHVPPQLVPDSHDGVVTHAPDGVHWYAEGHVLSTAQGNVEGTSRHALAMPSSGSEAKNHFTKRIPFR